MDKIYYISVPVEEIQGQQTFSIRAGSEELEKEILKRCEQDGEFCNQEIETTQLGWRHAEIVDVEEIEETDE